MSGFSTIEVIIGSTEGALPPRESLEIRKRLLRMGVAQAEFSPQEDVPEGAKAGEVLTLAAFTLALAPVVYPDVVSFFKEWIGLSKDRRVKIRKRNAEKEIELEYNLDDVDLDQMTELMAILDKEVE